MEESKRYDLIVVGLGCAGLSVAEYFSTQEPGSKVLGLEKNSISGDLTTSSVGHSRLFNYTPGFPLRNEMYEDSKSLWKEIEEKTGVNILHYTTLLYLGRPDWRLIKDAKKELSEDKFFTPEKITELYPAFENIPEDYTGFHVEDAGIVKSKVALDVYRNLWEENGVELKYETPVSKVTENEVELEDGTVYKADNVVVCSGPFTKDSFEVEDPDFVLMEQEFYEFSDNKDMPTMFQEDSEFGSMLGCLDNEGLLQYKVSRHGDINRADAEGWIKQRLPSKAEDILNKSTIFQAKWCFRKGKHFVYETQKGVHYTYGYRGNGFFYMPLHGRIVYETLLKKKPLRYAHI